MFHLLLLPLAIGSMFIVAFIYISIILFFIIKILSYILESIGLAKIAKKENYKYPYIAWILGLSHYILGKYCSDSDEKRNGLIYCFLTTVKIIFIILIFTTDAVKNSTLLIIAILYLFIYFIIDMKYMNKFYKKEFKNYQIFTVLTVITLGLLKPIFIFISAKKK